jgi:hypothetical protein
VITVDTSFFFPSSLSTTLPFMLGMDLSGATEREKILTSLQWYARQCMQQVPPQAMSSFRQVVQGGLQATVDCAPGSTTTAFQLEQPLLKPASQPVAVSHLLHTWALQMDEYIT